MFRKSHALLKLSLFAGIVFTLTFFACTQEDQIKTQEVNVEQSIFDKHSAAQSQFITAQDQGNGTYSLTGEQGTVITMDNSLVYPNGVKVRGAILVELKEIYTVADMILNRKQTLADYDGTNQILQSGGELFINITQDGQELSIAEDGNVEVLLPTSNTGGAKDNMELFLGEEIGEQIIWHPTGDKIQVIRSIERSNNEYYMMLLQNTLGWANVDVLWAAGGDPVECIEVIIECPAPCEVTNTVVAMHIPGVNTGVELAPMGGGVFRFCGLPGEPVLPLGGISVTFIVIIECADGSILVGLVTATINAGFHQEVISCDPLVHMGANELENYLQQNLN